MAKKDHDGPSLILAQYAFGSRHARWPDTVVDNPLQLSIGVPLHLLRGQRRHRWRHVVRKGHPSVLTIHAMAGDAIMRKSFLSIRYRHGTSWQWILLVFISNENMVLGEGDDALFQITRRTHLAAGQGHDKNSRGNERMAAHRYSTT